MSRTRSRSRPDPSRAAWRLPLRRPHGPTRQSLHPVWKGERPRRVALRGGQPGSHQGTQRDPGPRDGPGGCHRGLRGRVPAVPVGRQCRWPLSATIGGHVTMEDGGLQLAANVTNTGEPEGTATCRITRDGTPRPDDVTFRTDRLAAVTARHSRAPSRRHRGRSSDAARVSVVCSSTRRTSTPSAGRVRGNRRHGARGSPAQAAVRHAPRTGLLGKQRVREDTAHGRAARR